MKSRTGSSRAPAESLRSRTPGVKLTTDVDFTNTRLIWAINTHICADIFPDNLIVIASIGMLKMSVWTVVMLMLVSCLRLFHFILVSTCLGFLQLAGRVL